MNKLTLIIIVFMLLSFTGSTTGQGYGLRLVGVNIPSGATTPPINQLLELTSDSGHVLRIGIKSAAIVSLEVDGVQAITPASQGVYGFYKDRVFQPVSSVPLASGRTFWHGAGGYFENECSFSRTLSATFDNGISTSVVRSQQADVGAWCSDEVLVTQIIYAEAPDAVGLLYRTVNQSALNFDNHSAPWFAADSTQFQRLYYGNRAGNLFDQSLSDWHGNGRNKTDYPFVLFAQDDTPDAVSFAIVYGHSGNPDRYNGHVRTGLSMDTHENLFVFESVSNLPMLPGRMFEFGTLIVFGRRDDVARRCVELLGS